jgi:hypothetical protein
MTSTAFILDKINRRIQANSDATPVLCSVCQLPLTDPISKEAGKGPTCSRRIRFSEKLTRDQLAEVAGQHVELNEGNTVKTVIAKLNDETNPRFITVLSNDKSVVTYWDHSEYDALYEKGETVTDSLIKSWHSSPNQNFGEVSTLVEPKSQNYKDSFKVFEDSYKEELKSREKDYKTVTGVTVQSKKFLDNKQLQGRSNLIKNYRAEDNADFQARLHSGEYPIATLMARLSSSSIKGANDLLLILKSNYNDITPQDHGLTDEEITHALTHASKPIEKKIFSAVIKGKCNLDELAQAYKCIKESPKVLENYKKFNDLAS